MSIFNMSDEEKMKWKIENGIFTLNVVIPPNTTAIINLPDGSEEIQIGSGSYEYSCSIPK